MPLQKQGDFDGAEDDRNYQGDSNKGHKRFHFDLGAPSVCFKKILPV
jgi:hypothetical protein